MHLVCISGLYASRGYISVLPLQGGGEGATFLRGIFAESGNINISSSSLHWEMSVNTPLFRGTKGVNLRTADLVLLDVLQLLKMSLSMLLLASLSWIYHPVCSCLVSALCSYTLVLLFALPIWIYHTVCSCLVSELCSYTLVLLSALPIWIYHPVCSTANLDLLSSMQLLCE